jgi:hypothetical protein
VDDEGLGSGHQNAGGGYGSGNNNSPQNAGTSGGGGHQYRSINTQTSSNQRQIFDLYHRLLDCFINLLASASSQILRSIFHDVIMAHLFNNDLASEVRVYIIKIS